MGTPSSIARAAAASAHAGIERTHDRDRTVHRHELVDGAHRTLWVARVVAEDEQRCVGRLRSVAGRAGGQHQAAERALTDLSRRAREGEDRADHAHVGLRDALRARDECREGAIERDAAIGEIRGDRADALEVAGVVRTAERALGDVSPRVTRAPQRVVREIDLIVAEATRRDLADALEHLRSLSLLGRVEARVERAEGHDVLLGGERGRREGVEEQSRLLGIGRVPQERREHRHRVRRPAREVEGDAAIERRALGHDRVTLPCPIELGDRLVEAAEPHGEAPEAEVRERRDAVVTVPRDDLAVARGRLVHTTFVGGAVGLAEQAIGVLIRRRERRQDLELATLVRAARARDRHEDQRREGRDEHAEREHHAERRHRAQGRTERRRGADREGVRHRRRGRQHRGEHSTNGSLRKLPGVAVRRQRGLPSETPLAPERTRARASPPRVMPPIQRGVPPRPPTTSSPRPSPSTSPVPDMGAGITVGSARLVVSVSASPSSLPHQIRTSATALPLPLIANATSARPSPSRSPGLASPSPSSAAGPTSMSIDCAADPARPPRAPRYTSSRGRGAPVGSSKTRSPTPSPFTSPAARTPRAS
jgi:hypothetical protein